MRTCVSSWTVVFGLALSASLTMSSSYVEAMQESPLSWPDAGITQLDPILTQGLESTLCSPNRSKHFGNT
eukprot:12933365-Prorocentrum_lima.AAC.1